MPVKTNNNEPLFTTRWVHVFEEDGDAGNVYRPEDSDIPLSRRPRERFEIDADGSARVFAPGPDDRFIERAATWKDEGDAIAIREHDDGPELRIIDQSPTRLLVKTRRPG